VKLDWECHCERRHLFELDRAEALMGFTEDLRCTCGAVYAFSVTVLEPTRG
jgi:hypothetical protein